MSSLIVSTTLRAGLGGKGLAKSQEMDEKFNNYQQKINDKIAELENALKALGNQTHNSSEPNSQNRQLNFKEI